MLCRTEIHACNAITEEEEEEGERKRRREEVKKMKEGGKGRDKKTRSV